MRLLVLLVSVAVAFARPDVGLGYQYQVPTSYQVPSGSVGSLNTRQYYHVDSHGAQAGSFGPTVPSTIFQTPIHKQSSFTGIDGSTLRGQTSVGTLSNIGIGSQASQDSPERTFTTNRFSGDVSLSGQTNFANSNSQQTEVQRHLYFYAAPDEPEEIRPRVNIPISPPKKNVKILFIKAPPFRAPASIQIPIQPQNEEKTLVYVLVKKQETYDEIALPTPAPTNPSKPEVYFIKYKTQREAQEAISSVQRGVASAGTSVSANSIEGDQAFINKIGHDIVSSNQGENGISALSNAGNFDSNESFGLHERTNFVSGASSGSSSSGLTSESTFGSGQSSGIGLNSGITPSSKLEFDSLGFSGSTTPSSLDSLTIAGRTSGGSGIHETYGPPK